MTKKWVRYIGCDDGQVKWGNNDDPRPLLVEGETYEVIDVEVHTWHTKYTLKGYERYQFNSVCFEPENKPDNIVFNGIRFYPDRCLPDGTLAFIADPEDWKKALADGRVKPSRKSFMITDIEPEQDPYDAPWIAEVKERILCERPEATPDEVDVVLRELPLPSTGMDGRPIPMKIYAFTQMGIERLDVCRSITTSVS